jgi:hypothetical protein
MADAPPTAKLLHTTPQHTHTHAHPHHARPHTHNHNRSHNHSTHTHARTYHHTGALGKPAKSKEPYDADTWGHVDGSP